jgi:hypothetical protein
MNRLRLTVLGAIGIALTGQTAVAVGAVENSTAPAAATKPSPPAKDDAKPAEKPVVAAKSTPAAVVVTKTKTVATKTATSKTTTSAKPISAWRAAYIAKHHHEPPVKAH